MTIMQIAENAQNTNDNIGSRDTTKNTILKRSSELIQIEENSTRIKTNTLGHSWIVGSSTNGLVGTNTATEDGQQQVVGSAGRVETIVRIVNPNNTFREHFRDTDFKDGTQSNTADWNITSYRLAMSTGTSHSTSYNTIATTKSIFLNSETITKAKVTATTSVYGNDVIQYLLSADGGSNWEEVTANVEHQFTNTGNDLRLKIIFIGNGGADTYISALNVIYTAG